MIPKGERWQVMVEVVHGEDGQIQAGLKGVRFLPTIGDINPIPDDMTPPELMLAVHTALGIVFQGQCQAQKPRPQIQVARGNVARN